MLVGADAVLAVGVAGTEAVTGFIAGVLAGVEVTEAVLVLSVFVITVAAIGFIVETGVLRTGVGVGAGAGAGLGV
ncbi:MAG: hypothetical protein RL138_430 [Bacteroidota bacterium]